MNLNAVRVFVKDIASAREFYSERLALPIKADGSAYGYCVFNAGSTELVVETVPNDAPEEDRALVGRFTGLSFTVQDVTAKHQELVNCGVKFTGLPEKQHWGGIWPLCKTRLATSFRSFNIQTDA